MALGVLTQPQEPHQQPIVYLSRELDVISLGWPHCLRVIGAATVWAPETLKIINGWNPAVLTSHDVSGILNSKVNIWMTDSSLLKYQSLLLEGPVTKLKVCVNLNPATFQGKWNTWSRLFPIPNFKLCSSGRSNGYPVRQSWHVNI